LFQVTGEETNQKLPCHQAKNSINSLAPSVGTIQSFLQKQNFRNGDWQDTLRQQRWISEDLDLLTTDMGQ
jgi:hypothetical protein